MLSTYYRLQTTCVHRKSKADAWSHRASYIHTYIVHGAPHNHCNFDFCLSRAPHQRHAMFLPNCKLEAEEYQDPYFPGAYWSLLPRKAFFPFLIHDLPTCHEWMRLTENLCHTTSYCSFCLYLILPRSKAKVSTFNAL